jgi:hypothetical protein
MLTPLELLILTGIYPDFFLASYKHENGGQDKRDVIFLDVNFLHRKFETIKLNNIPTNSIPVITNM